MRPSVAMLGWVAAIVCAGCLVGVLAWGPRAGEPKPDKPAAPQRDVLAPSQAIGLPPKSDTYEVIGWRRGIKSFVVKYDSRLYRGGQVTGEDGMAALKEWRVTTILSVTPDAAERALAKAAGMTLIEVPFDRKTGVPKAELEKFLQTVSGQTGVIYLHCKAGCQRAGALAAAYRVHVQGWDFNKAAVEYGRLGGNLRTDHKLLESIRVRP